MSLLVFRELPSISWQMLGHCCQPTLGCNSSVALLGESGVLGWRLSKPKFPFVLISGGRGGGGGFGVKPQGKKIKFDD